MCPSLPESSEALLCQSRVPTPSPHLSRVPPCPALGGNQKHPHYENRGLFRVVSGLLTNSLLSEIKTPKTCTLASSLQEYEEIRL